MGIAVKAEKLKVWIHVMNVDSNASVKSARNDIREDSGGVIDALANHAGIECRGSVEEMPLGEFRAVVETNYFGAIHNIVESGTWQLRHPVGLYARPKS